MSKIFSYNYEIISPKDIIDYCETQGCKVVFHKLIPGQQEPGFVIEGTPILIRYPDINYVTSLKFHPAVSLMGDLKWNTYSKIYTSKKDELYKQHEQFFNKLKRKFQMKKGEIPKSIKDLDWLKTHLK